MQRRLPGRAAAPARRLAAALIGPAPPISAGRACGGLLPAGSLPSSAPVEFANHFADFVILTTIALIWGMWARLKLGLSRPAYWEAEPWVLLFILWNTAEWAISLFWPTVVDPEWLAERERLTLAEHLIASALLAPVAEELLFRGTMFAALLRRWGIWPAALVPSALWALLHVQYEWWVVASTAGSGVLLAMVRWKSGSIWLPIALHAAGNLLATLAWHNLLGSGA